MGGQKQCTDLHTKHYGIKEELHEKDSYTHLADRTLSAAPMENFVRPESVGEGR